MLGNFLKHPNLVSKSLYSNQLMSCKNLNCLWLFQPMKMVQSGHVHCMLTGVTRFHHHKVVCCHWQYGHCRKLFDSLWRISPLVTITLCSLGNSLHFERRVWRNSSCLCSRSTLEQSNLQKLLLWLPNQLVGRGSEPRMQEWMLYSRRV